MKLFIYPTPLDSSCILRHDFGYVTSAVPGVDANSRPGQYFNIPENTPDRWGCKILIIHKGKIDLEFRSILMNDGTAWRLLADDFILADVPVAPPVPIPVPPNPIPPVPFPTEPADIIDYVYDNGSFDLSTKTGCGQFTEACCKALHEKHSVNWGHVKKLGAQNQYNGHAVDAIQLLTDKGSTNRGIYDIIISSESPDADPAFNWAGDPRADLFYYPA